ncbi:MAG: hypothetical protein H6623_03860 [Bdellovibrionaceae bacterium]|nr:hypothetical protein [Pseudobdellovibrionaceae bacterium]
MGLSKTHRDFEELKKTYFSSGETPYMMWNETPVVDTKPEVDVIEQFRFNMQSLEELNSRFQFVLQELSTVLVKKKH